MREPFVITQEDDDVTQADGVADALQDLFLYRVPIGMRMILRPTDVFCIHVRETDDTVGQNTALVKLEHRDSANVEKKPLLGPIQYANFSASGIGEFQDKKKLIHLDIQRDIIVEEQEYITVMVKNPSPYADKDLSYFSLRTHRER